MKRRRRLRRCRRQGHPTSLMVTLWDGDVLDVCYCVVTAPGWHRIKAKAAA